MRARRANSLLERKIKSPKELKTIAARLKRNGKRIVFTNGCFDLLHYGHVKYMEDARKKGDVLVVAINSDSSVKKIKGKERPIVPACDRIRTIAALESVDYVLLFNDTTPLETIKKLKPDVLIKGADWKKGDIVGADFVLGYGGRVETIRLVKGRSTTHFINKIAKIH